MTATRTDTFRLGLVQHACPVDVSPSQNLRKAMAMMRDAAGRGCDLIVTQELFTSHYFCQSEDAANFHLAEPIPGPTSHKLCELAKKLKVNVSASLFEKRAPGVHHNTTIVIDKRGRIVGRYRKMHIPHDPRFFEKYYFTPGDGPGWCAHQLDKAAIGTLICWDQWYPEAARLTALRGAQVLLYPTAIGYAHAIEPPGEPQRQIDAWQTVQRAHAITNGVFVAACTRVGIEGGLTFWGRSFVADPGGRVIAEASADQDEVLVADCDLALIDQARVNWPFLRDRRIDAYGDLTRRYID